MLLHIGEPGSLLVNGQPTPAPATGMGEQTFDITGALLPEGLQEIAARGPAAARLLASAWVEIVPTTYITRVLADTVATGEALNITVSASGPDAVALELRDGVRVVASGKGAAGERIWLKPEQPRFWSPADPFLYQLHVELGSGDTVESYAAMRNAALAKDAQGFARIQLNQRPLFLFGHLADGAADPATLLRLGFNTVRQRSVQPARWYAECDRLGLLVWQDMPAPASPQLFRRDALALVESLRAHPSIVLWTLFDEGQGQEAVGLDAARALAGEIVRLDPTRLVNGGSGWFDTGNGQIHDFHFTPGPGMFPLGQRRASVLGRFGGLPPAPRGEVRRAYRELMGKLSLYRAMGLSGAIYAPTGGETAAQALGAEWLATTNRRMLANAPQVESLAGGDEPWEYTLAEAGAGREGWRTGSGIYGKSLRNIQPGTPWTAPTIRLRRTFRWTGASDEVYLVLWAIRGAALEVKLNGERIAHTDGQGGESPEFIALKGNPALRAGDNVAAIEARRVRTASSNGVDAAFEARIVAVTGDKFGFADPMVSRRPEYPLVGVDGGKADLALHADQFISVRSRRPRPAGTHRGIAFLREMGAATAEQIYYALLSAGKDGFDGVALHVAASSEAARVESELKIRNIQEWFKRSSGSFPLLHATGLDISAFDRKTGNAPLFFAATPEKPRPLDAVALTDFPGTGERWKENMRLLIRAAQGRWPLMPESTGGGAGGLYAYASYLLGVEAKSAEASTRLAIPLGELDAHYFWPIGEPAESVTPGNLERYKAPGATVYRRRFVNGVVAVNPGELSQTLELENALMDAATRQVLRTVELPPRSAKILLRPGVAAGPGPLSR